MISNSDWTVKLSFITVLGGNKLQVTELHTQITFSSN